MRSKYGILLLIVFAAAVGIFLFTGGSFLNVRLLGRVDKAPSDQEENMVYGQQYTVLSENILERDGIILYAQDSTLQARELSSGINLVAADISSRSDRGIQSFSEYVSYLYLFDGTTVYWYQIGGDGKLHTAIRDCTQFIPMGTYLYSLRDLNGTTYLYRCSLTGSYEKILFGVPVVDFEACDGNLLYLDDSDHYTWWNVLTGSSMEHVFPTSVEDIKITADGILYISDGVLYYRSFLSSEDSVISENCRLFNTGVHNAVFISGEDVYIYHTSDGSLSRLNCDLHDIVAVDISAEYVFVKTADNSLYYSNNSDSDWVLLQIE